MICVMFGSPPSKARSARERYMKRWCWAGCNVSETLQHILQVCDVSHNFIILRHDAQVKYLKQKSSPYNEGGDRTAIANSRRLTEARLSNC